MSQNELQELIIQDKPSEMLLTLKSYRRKLFDKGGKPYAQKLSTEADTTYAHTVKILNKLDEQGLIEYEKQGRKKCVELTEHGEKVAEAVEQLVETLEEAAKQETV